MTLLEIMLVVSVITTMLGATFVGLTADGLNVVTGLLVGINVCLLSFYGWRAVCEKVRQRPLAKSNRVTTACLELIFVYWLMAGGLLAGWITFQLTYPHPTKDGQLFHVGSHSNNQP